jgi:hypothetical protein
MRYIVSVSWGDHLSFGEGDGRLDTPERLRRPLAGVAGRAGCSLVALAHATCAYPWHLCGRSWLPPSVETAANGLGWDDFEIVPAMAREAGVSPWLYATAVGRRMAARPRGGAPRQLSQRDARPARGVAERSDSRSSRVAGRRSCRPRAPAGVVSLSYPEARRAFIDRWIRLIEPTTFDGLFLCLRSQSPTRRHLPTSSDSRARPGVIFL